MVSVEMAMITILFEVDEQINERMCVEHKGRCLAGISVFNYVGFILLHHVMLLYTNLRLELPTMAAVPYLVGKLLFTLENSVHILLCSSCALTR